MPRNHSVRFVILLAILTLLSSGSLSAITQTKKKKSGLRRAAARAALVKTAARKANPHLVLAVAAKPVTKTKAAVAGHWRVPNYADSTLGDRMEGEDLTARQAAVGALGKLNGSVVVADANTGRILSIVNQKLAFKSGFQPCSTIKVPVALAALSETVVDRSTTIRLYGRTSMNMTEALARSSNQYFASLGEKLGFEKVSYYARLFGLGEKAGLDIDGEQAGILPPETPKSGMGMMTSFGDGIDLTPLEYAALMGAVANGGTLYYLQYPRNRQDAETMIPRVKRRLDIGGYIPEIKPGMMGAVEYGTARRIGFDPNEPIYGKTGTCTDSRSPTHLGWFGSFTEVGSQKLVVVVLLTGGSAVSGPAASGVAGQVYRNLGSQNYFARAGAAQPAALSTIETAR